MTQAADAADPPMDDRDDDPQPIEISDRWRWASGVASVAALIAGGFAVFKTEVEAGPVALLGVGLIFGMITCAGVVPWKIKFGNTELELRKARKENRALQNSLIELGKLPVALETTAQAAEPNQNSRVAYDWSRLGEILDQLAEEAPEASTTVGHAIAYERAVLRAIQEVADQFGATFTGQSLIGRELRFDAKLTSTSGRIVFIEVKARRGPISRADIDQLLGPTVRLHPSKVSPILLITNRHVSSSVAADLQGRKDIELLVLGDSNDTATLVATLQRLLD